MARKKLDQQMMAALRQDAREAEREADSRQPYPGGHPRQPAERAVAGVQPAAQR